MIVWFEAYNQRQSYIAKNKLSTLFVDAYSTKLKAWIALILARIHLMSN